jgi:hypothetical protein
MSTDQPAPPTKSYRITSGLYCHDVRLNTSIQIEVALDHFPSEQEAIRLLCPTAEAVVTKNFCEGCPYEFYGIQITPSEGP